MSEQRDGALDARRAHNNAIIDRIVKDKAQTSRDFSAALDARRAHNNAIIDRIVKDKAQTSRDFSAALDARRAHNDAIIDRIVKDKVQTSHILRCLLQGCHYATADGPVCQFCGAERREPVTLGHSLIRP